MRVSLGRDQEFDNRASIAGFQLNLTALRNLVGAIRQGASGAVGECNGQIGWWFGGEIKPHILPLFVGNVGVCWW